MKFAYFLKITQLFPQLSTTLGVRSLSNKLTFMVLGFCIYVYSFVYPQLEYQLVDTETIRLFSLSQESLIIQKCLAVIFFSFFLYIFSGI